MKVVSWRGWEPDDDNLWIGLDTDVYGQWSPVFSSIARRGSTAVYTDAAISERTIGAEFGNNDPSRSIETAWKLALQRLNPLDTSDGELIITFNDDPNTEWSCLAKLSQPAPVAEEATDNFDIAWITTDPLWHSTDVETAAGALTPATITNPTFASNTTGWTQGSLPSGVTAAFTRDAGVFYDQAGSGRVQVTVNSGSGGFWYVENNTQYPCAPGDVIQVKAATRSSVGFLSNAGLAATPVVRWYNVANAFISETPVDAFFLPGDVMPANTWVLWWTRGSDWSAAAPAGTAYAKLGIQIGASAGATGSVYFDAFEFLTAPTGSATPFEVEGNAPTHLTLTATPAGNFPQAIYARRFTITNNGDQVWTRQPIWIDLGDNSGGSTTGAYWALLREGRVQPCHITDYDRLKAFLLLVVDLPAGQSADYTLLVSDQTILPNTTFNSYTAPAFDHGHIYGSASGGGHSTTVTNTSGLGSENNRWDEGVIYVLTGVNAGLTRRISASTATSITHAAFPNANANGAQYLIMMSHNGILDGQADWVYPVQQTERSDNVVRGRGLWWLESGQKRPSNYRSDVPGGWSPTIYLDNADHFNQKWVTAFDPGGGNDFFALFDANRTWQGGSNLKDEGGFDGVSVNSPWDITTFKFDYQLKNPNAMAKLVVLSQRLGGALEMLEEFSDNAALDTLTNRSEQTLTLEAGTKRLSVHLVPNTGDEIGEGWAGDSGTATSATSTTLVDASKDGVWTSGQFNGGWIEIKTGLGAGQNVAITGTNSNGTITVASWPLGTPDSTSRYLIKNRSYVATARSRTTWRISLSTATLGISAVTAETPAFVLYRDILLNSVDGPGDETEIQRVVINPETTGRYIVLLASESLVIDGEAMRAWIADGSGNELRPVPPQAYSVLDVAADGSRRAAPYWLRVNPGDHSITLATDESGVACTVDVEYQEALYS